MMLDDQPVGLVEASAVLELPAEARTWPASCYRSWLPATAVIALA